jgi:hypothetical protein
MAEKPTQNISPGAQLAVSFNLAQTPQPDPPVDHEVTKEELDAMSLDELANMIESNTTIYDGLTLTNRNALVRLLRATTEA